MTRKARSLGMSKTIYRNASGLPERRADHHGARPGHARPRDPGSLPALLPLLRDHDASFISGNAIRNHNRLLGNVEGVDGIKTGYTRASGFNLVTSMRRGNRHLVARGAGRPQRRLARRHHAQPAGRKSREGRDQAHRCRHQRARPGRSQYRGRGRRCQTGREVQVQGAVQVAAASEPGLDAMQAPRVAAPAKPSLMAAAAANLCRLSSKPG